MFVLSLSLFFIFIKHTHTHMITGQLDMVIIGAGTGGTVTGIGRKMKEKLPNVEVSVTHSLTMSPLLIDYCCGSYWFYFG